MKPIVRMLLTAVLCGSGAYASTITYNLSGTLTDGASLSGTMTIDNVAGVATAIDFILGAPDTGTFTVIEFDSAPFGVWFIEGGLTGSSPGTFPLFSLLLPVSTLVGYGGGALCSVALPCAGFISNLAPTSGGAGINLLSGTATAGVGAVPEPATLTIMGIGLLAIGLMRASSRIRGARKMAPAL
jgi:hypothetical protein